jgi:formylglycine-generating enzyme required for sulfatase activity
VQADGKARPSGFAESGAAVKTANKRPGRKTMKGILVSFLIAAMGFAATSGHAANRSVRVKGLQEMRSEKRVALVIGNSDYKSSPLKNPVNDARLIAKTLRDLGFEVIARENADQNQMKMAIDAFGKKIKGGGVGLFYYAGHGMEVNGRNYLIPISTNINNENEVEYESVDAGRVLAKMENAGNRVSIVMLDACRDNPFARNFRSASKGLAQTVAPEGSYIAYAAQPGAVASDGSGNNSVFTEEFVKAIRAEGVEINKAFRQVRAAVMQKTGNKQVPWTSESLTGDFYFKLPTGGSATQETAAQVPAAASDAPAAEKKAKKVKKPVQVAQVEAQEEPAVSPRTGNYTDPETGMEFVLVKGGCYQMGDTFGDGSDDEKPVHEVCVDDFYIGKYEVTQGQWRTIRGNNHSYFSNCGDNCPVEQVSWNDIQDYIRILNQQTGKTYRLPTEAEWEYAARSGGKSEKYSGGNNVDSVAWYKANAGSQTHPVGRKQPNGLGIYDMSGNVWEWCNDIYDEHYYRNSPRDNPRGPSSGSLRVLRGGPWGRSADYARAADRNWNDPVDGVDFHGFRLVRTE